jgi:hypothetical protein
MKLRIGKNFEIVIHPKGERPMWKQVKPKKK